MILSAEGATPLMYDQAKAVLEALCEVYPNHPWGVEVRGDDTGGSIFIRYLLYEGRYGMLLKHSAKETTFYSASALKRAVVMQAGEWLERAGLARGIGEGYEPIKRIEGVPEKQQPQDFSRPALSPVAPDTLRDKPHRPLQEKEEWPNQTGST